MLLAGLLAGAAVQAQVLRPFSAAPPGAPPLPWRITGLLGSSKPITKFEVVTLDSERVLQVATDKSYGILIHDLEPMTLQPGSLLRWRWRLDQPLLNTDLTRKSGDDAPIKVCAMFDLPMQNMPFIERNMLRLAQGRSPNKLPTATLCYVWDHLLPAGTELVNAFTQQIRFVIVDSGEANLKQWVGRERDLHKDFLKAFGDQSSTVPPLIGIAVGADADNTAATSLGFVADMRLLLPPGVVVPKPAADKPAGEKPAGEK